MPVLCSGYQGPRLRGPIRPWESHSAQPTVDTRRLKFRTLGTRWQQYRRTKLRDKLPLACQVATWEPASSDGLRRELLLEKWG